MKQNLQNDMFDAMLRSAFQERRQQGDRELLTEQELREQDIEPQQFSPAFERKMRKLIKKVERREWRRMHRKTMQCAAALFAVMILTGGVLVTKVDAVRIPVMNFVINVSEEFSDIQVVDSERKLELSEASNDYLPCYVPEGFSVEFVEEYSDTWIVQYTDRIGEYYSIDFYRSAINGSMDTEGATVTEQKINGYPALIIDKKDYLTVVWCPDGSEYIISGTISMEEVNSILSSIKSFS